MTGTVFRISWISLRRDRVALVLTLVLPVVMFSIFAAVFGTMDQGAIEPVRAAFVIEDRHPFGRLLAAKVGNDPMIELEDDAAVAGKQRMVDRVASGAIRVGVVVPDGFFESLMDPEAPSRSIELFVDRSHPMAAGLMRGLLQAAALQIRHDAFAGSEATGIDLDTLALNGGAQLGFKIRDHDVLGHGDKRPSISFFAAGMGIMFLMFGVAGRSAILIEERETGVLTRLLAARVTLTQLILGRWLFLVALGSVQVFVMFSWAWLAFGLDLWTPRHLAGFAVMTAVSAAAAAGFGLMLSAVCRSRAQLTGIATVSILILSALGGSLFPDFLMPEQLRRLGRIAFNSWALEGYRKVFWYDAAVVELLPQVGVLLVSSLSFLLLARWFVGRRVEA